MLPTTLAGYGAHTGGAAPPQLPGYARFMAKAAGLPQMPGGDGPGGGAQADMADADFADSAVATVDLTVLRDWCTEEEWRRVVRPFTDSAAFEQEVLLPDWRRVAAEARQQVREPRFTAKQIAQLFDKRYVERERHPGFVCTIFAVWKSDGITLRLIWNGQWFNIACHRPPPFTITKLPRMLAKLTSKHIRCYMCFDFQTWFVQLRVPPGVARFFCTILRGGRVVRLNGVPMGAAWACVLAHTLTVAFTRAVLKECRDRGVPEPAVAEFCIDNTIYGLADAAHAAPLREIVESVAARFNIQLKASAWEVGAEVDWLVYRLRAGQRPLWKDSFKETLRRVVTSAPRMDLTVLAAWQVMGVVGFATYAACLPHTLLRRVTLWAAAAVPRTDREWLAPAAGFPRDVLVKLAEALQIHPIRPPGLAARRWGAWFITDASTSGDAASVVVVGERLYLRVEAVPEEYERIEARELHMHLRATEQVLDLGVQDAHVLGYGDNTTALSAQRKGAALWAPPRLENYLVEVHGLLKARTLTLIAPHVSTHACVPDAWTRRPGTRRDEVFACSAGCAHEPGTLCGPMQRALEGWLPDGEPFPQLATWLAVQRPAPQPPCPITGILQFGAIARPDDWMEALRVQAPDDATD